MFELGVSLLRLLEASVMDVGHQRFMPHSSRQAPQVFLGEDDTSMVRVVEVLVHLLGRVTKIEVGRGLSLLCSQ